MRCASTAPRARCGSVYPQGRPSRDRLHAAATCRSLTVQQHSVHRGQDARYAHQYVVRQREGSERPLRTTFETVKLLQTGMAAAADGMKGSENPKVKAAGTAIGLIGEALGRAEKSQQTVTATVADGSLELQTTTIAGCGPTVRGGPGVSDGYMFLENARLVWLYANGRMSIALLGARADGCKYVSTLRKALARLRRERIRPNAIKEVCINRAKLPKTPGAITARATQAPRPCRNGLDIPSLAALLALDPFVAGGAQTPLAAERFAPSRTARALRRPARHTAHGVAQRHNCGHTNRHRVDDHHDRHEQELLELRRHRSRRDRAHRQHRHLLKCDRIPYREDSDGQCADPRSAARNRPFPGVTSTACSAPSHFKPRSVATRPTPALPLRDTAIVSATGRVSNCCRRRFGRVVGEGHRGRSMTMSVRQR